MPLSTSVTSAARPNRRHEWRRHEDKRLIQRERELEASRRICEALFQHTDVDKIVEMALRATLDVLDAGGGSVLLADLNAGQLVFRYSIGDRPVPKGTTMPMNQGIAGLVFRSGKSEIVADARQDSRHYRQVDDMTGFESHDMIVFPLKRWEGEPIGVFEVLNKRGGRLGEDALPILTIVSAFTATAIEQARLFQEARLAEVARLMGDISHDIKNMLMPITCGAGLLRTEFEELFAALSKLGPVSEGTDASREMCAEVIGLLLDGARRINDRVKEMADCVKGLSARPVFAPCCLANVVELVLKSLRFLAEDRKITLTTKGLDTLPTILADERRLYNAMYNLINNAIAEVSPGGSVNIHGRQGADPGIVLLSVADTGRGMDPEVRESLFTSSTISRKAGGTGLGTKIVKDVVDSHGGHIAVESKIGVGTTFLITLPVQPPGASADRAIP